MLYIRIIIWTQRCDESIIIFFIPHALHLHDYTVNRWWLLGGD